MSDIFDNFDDYVTFSNCVACGQPMDYCTGHGEIGDPHGASVLDAHDDGQHHECHPAGCDVAAEFAAGVESLTGLF